MKKITGKGKEEMAEHLRQRYDAMGGTIITLLCVTMGGWKDIN